MTDDRAPFYELLAVDETASTQEIERQFRRLVKQYHPDQGGSEETYIRLQTARKTLSSPVERRRYDRLGHHTYVKNVGAKRWIAWDHAQTSSAASSEPTDNPTAQEETEDGNRQESGETDSTEGTTNAGRQRSSDDRESTSTTSKSRSHGQTGSGSDRKTKDSQTHNKSAGKTTAGETTQTTGSERDTGYASNSASRQTRAATSDQTAHASGATGFTVPRVLLAVVLAYAIAVAFRTISTLSASTVAAIAVGVGLVAVVGNELRIYYRNDKAIDPQLSPSTAGYIAVSTAIGSGLLAIAVSHGSLNGGLLLGRFVLLFYLGLFIPIGMLLFGLFYIGGNVDPYIAGGATVCVLAGLVLIEFTPYRFWFPFTALAAEPASTIAPWVPVGAAAGFTVGWAVNIILGLLMSVTLCVGLVILLGLFSHLLRGANKNKTGRRIIGWELLASTPFVLLGWWHLSENQLWVLHGTPPESAVAAGLILSVCCWPTVVFGAYSLLERS